jgi:hypothetical protein
MLIWINEHKSLVVYAGCFTAFFVIISWYSWGYFEWRILNQHRYVPLWVGKMVCAGPYCSSVVGSRLYSISVLCNIRMVLENFTFSNKECADIHFMYGLCNWNTLAAVAEYQRLYLRCRMSSRHVFSTVYWKWRKRGRFPSMPLPADTCCEVKHGWWWEHYWNGASQSTHISTNLPELQNIYYFFSPTLWLLLIGKHPASLFIRS